MLFPDAWKVQIKIRNLCPPSFNMYAEYYQNGFNLAQVATMQQTPSLTDIVGEMLDYVSDLTSRTYQSVSDFVVQNYEKIKDNVENEQ